MRVVPVIDLMNGQVVRGIAGRRSEYRPIQSSIAADARPATVSRAFVERFGFDTVYVADLDAIMHRKPDVQAWEEIRGAGLELWLDAGVGTPQGAAALDERLTATAPSTIIVVGLESVPAPLCVFDIAARCRGRRFAFSLDLQQGRPATKISMWKDEQPLEIARWVIKASVQRLIVLDLADVGIAAGTRTLELCRDIRRLFPAIELIAGGGVRGSGDLQALADAGCDAALVASALHDGRLTAEDVRQAENLPR